MKTNAGDEVVLDEDGESGDAIVGVEARDEGGDGRLNPI
jgi:hypothetical protein